MPNVLIWNIKDFGARFANDANSQALRRALIDGIVQDTNTDILLIQEVRATAGPELVALRQELNQGNNDKWGFDWVGGALVNNTTAPAFADVGFPLPRTPDGPLACT
jgi:hypothetical protein